MRTINISNQQKRNAQIGFELQPGRKGVQMAHPSGAACRNVRLLKASAARSLAQLMKEHGPDLTDAILNSDAEIDMERVGMRLSGVKKVFVGADNKVACSVNRQLVFFNPDGTERETKKFHTTEANINTDAPLRWTGKLIPRSKACRMFVFTHKYQIRHVNGLTFDFLFDMARTLHESDSVMLLGAGGKGAGPVVMNAGGVPYRAFLEGRIQGESYCLIMHLTNLELKPIV